MSLLSWHFLSQFFIPIENFYLPCRKTKLKQTWENFVKKSLYNSEIVKTCDELDLSSILIIWKSVVLLSISSLISATPLSKACSPEQMEAKLSDDKQSDIGGGCWRLCMDFLKPSLARHQLAIDNLNFSCCSSETPGDPELAAITGYPDPSGFVWNQNKKKI